MGTGFAKKKKESRLIQQQLAQMQEQARHSTAEGIAGNGLVRILLSGSGEVKSVKIDRSCVDPEDVEGLQDLIKAALQDGLNKLNQLTPTLPETSMSWPGLPTLP